MAGESAGPWCCPRHPARVCDHTLIRQLEDYVTGVDSSRRLERKRRLVRAFERYIQNPPVRAMVLAGLPTPIFALIETTGRKTGKPRRTPVIKGLIGDQFWIVAEHGHAAGYVKNLKANPRVRVKVGRRWRSGTAHLLDDDDPIARARWMREVLGRWHFADAWAARTFGTEPITVRVDLDPC